MAPNVKTPLTQIVLLVVLVMLLFTSCKTHNMFVPVSNMPAKIDSSFYQITDSYQYRIRKNDKLNISIWNNDDISVGSIFGIYNSGEGYGKWLMVDANGSIPVPQVGDLKVEGLTVLEAKTLLSKVLSKTIVNPVIDVKILNKEITILGEVKNPGKISLEKDKYTLVEILGLAGDFELYGNKAKVQVIRMINNEAHYITVDLSKMNGYTANNIRVLPGDVLYVPARKSKEWDKRAGSTVIPVASAVTTLILILKTYF
jgi:polysaccharide export outer membrane protein